MKRKILISLAAVFSTLFIAPSAAHANTTVGCHVYSPWAWMDTWSSLENRMTMKTANFVVQTCGSTYSDIDITQVYIYNRPAYNIDMRVWLYDSGGFIKGPYTSTGDTWQSMSNSDSPHVLLRNVKGGTRYHIEVDVDEIPVWLGQVRD